MKSSTLFQCGPLPPYVHLVSTRRHSCDRHSQAFPASYRHASSLVPRLIFVRFFFPSRDRHSSLYICSDIKSGLCEPLLMNTQPAHTPYTYTNLSHICRPYLHKQQREVVEHVKYKGIQL